MAEPHVGMSFGHYKTCNDSLAGNYKKETETKNRSNRLTSGSAATTYYRYTDAKGKTIATSEVFVNQSFQGWQGGGQWHSSATFNISSGGLIWSGESDEIIGKTTPNNCKFTRIIGSQTYAEDLNGNGIVDEGEVFSFADNKKYNQEAKEYNTKRCGGNGLRSIPRAYKPTNRLDCKY